MANRRPPQGRRMDFSRNDRGKSFRPGVSPWQGGTPGSDIPNLLPLAGGSTEATLALASNIINLLQPRQTPVPSLLDMPIRRDFGPSMGRYDRGYGPNRMGNQNNFRRSGNYNRAGERINSNRKPFRPHDGQRQQNKSSPKKEADSKSKSKESEQDKKDSDSTEKTENKQDDKKEPQKTRYDDINPQLLKCHICNKSMWDGRSFENHLSGRAHAIMMQKTAESYALTADTMRQEFKIREMKRTRKSGQQQVRDFYCAMCDMYAADGSAHRTTVGHRKLKKYLHPTCTSCHKEMPTRIELDEHRLTPEHLSMMQDKQEVVGKPKPEVMVISTLHTEQLYLRDDRQRFKRQGEEKEREKREKEGEQNKEGAEKESEGADEPKEGEGEKEKVDKDDTIIDFKEGDDLTNITSDRFPEYSTERGVGRSFLTDFSCVQCALCRKLLDTRETAELHLRTWRHHQLFVRMLQERSGKEFVDDATNVIDERVMLLVLDLSRTLLENGYVHAECSTDEDSESDKCGDNSELPSGILNDLNDHINEQAINNATEVAMENVEGDNSDASSDSYMSLLRSLSKVAGLNKNYSKIKTNNNKVQNVKNTVETAAAVNETNINEGDTKTNNNKTKDDINNCISDNTNAIEKCVNMDVSGNIVNNECARVSINNDVTNDLIDKNHGENITDDVVSQELHSNSSVDEKVANEFENDRLLAINFSEHNSDSVIADENCSDSIISEVMLNKYAGVSRQVSVYENVLEQINSLKDLLSNVKNIHNGNESKCNEQGNLVGDSDINKYIDDVNGDSDRNNDGCLGNADRSTNFEIRVNSEGSQTNLNFNTTAEGPKRDENANVIASITSNYDKNHVVNNRKNVQDNENNPQQNCIVPNARIKQEPIEECYKENEQPTCVDTNENISHNINNSLLIIIKQEPVDDYVSASDRNISVIGHKNIQQNMLMAVKDEPLDPCVEDVNKKKNPLIVIKKELEESRNVVKSSTDKTKNQQKNKNVKNTSEKKAKQGQVNKHSITTRPNQNIVSSNSVYRNEIQAQESAKRPHGGEESGNWKRRKASPELDEDDRAENGHEPAAEEAGPVKEEKQVEEKKDGAEGEMPAADELEDWEQSVDEILRDVKAEAIESEQQEQLQPKVEQKTPEKKQDEQENAQENTQESKEQHSGAAENKVVNNAKNSPLSSPRGRGRGRPRRY